MKSMLLAIAGLQMLSFSAFALEKISEPKVSQTIQVNKEGKIAGVKSLVSFKALSGGCTDVSHFSLDVKVGDSEQEVSVTRIVVDVCEGASIMVDIALATDKLELSDSAGKAIKFQNPAEVDFTFEQLK